MTNHQIEFILEALERIRYTVIWSVFEDEDLKEENNKESAEWLRGLWYFSKDWITDNEFLEEFCYVVGSSVLFVEDISKTIMYDSLADDKYYRHVMGAINDCDQSVREKRAYSPKKYFETFKSYRSFNKSVHLWKEDVFHRDNNDRPWIDDEEEEEEDLNDCILIYPSETIKGSFSLIIGYQSDFDALANSYPEMPCSIPLVSREHTKGLIELVDEQIKTQKNHPAWSKNTVEQVAYENVIKKLIKEAETKRLELESKVGRNFRIYGCNSL